MMEEIYTFTLFNTISYVASVSLTLLLISFVYWLFFVPWYSVLNLSDLGYNHLKEECKIRGLKMKDLVNYTNKLRKRGDLPPMYPNGWIPLLSSKQLEIGKAKSVYALGETFAVFRDTKGKVHILDAYCPHLGANLAIGGRVVDDCIQCPFHRWEFRGNDGKCTRIPYTNKVPASTSIKAWKSFEVNNFIFVWYHAEEDEPTWFPPEIPQITSEEWVFQGGHEHKIAAHIQEFAENSSDIQHFTYIHEPSLLKGANLAQKDGVFFQILKHHWKASCHKYDHSEKHIATLNIQHNLELFGKKSLLNLNVVIEMIGPALTFAKLSTSKEFGAFTYYITPVSPTEISLCMKIYTSAIGPIAKALLLTEKINIERDIVIWNNKMFLKSAKLVKEEKSISEFRRWYSQFYSENSSRFLKQDLNDW